MMQPDNPVVGGTILRRPAIQSPGFQTGVQGWALNADGSSEFNNTAVRGELDVGTSPNARISITGNVPAVLATWAAANSVVIKELMIFYWNLTDFKWWATGTFSGQQCVFVGTYDTTNGVYVLERNLNTGGAAPVETRFGSYALNTTQELWTTQRLKLQIGDGSNISDAFVCNGTAISNAIDYNLNGRGLSEVWEALGLQNSWVNFGAPFVTAQYRLVPSPARSVQLTGVIQNGTATPGTVIGNLPGTPVNYRPTNTHRIPIYAFGAGMNISTEIPAIDIGSNGDIVLRGTTGAGVITFEGLFSLDA